jgi:hypothetical protein
MLETWRAAPRDAETSGLFPTDFRLIGRSASFCNRKKIQSMIEPIKIILAARSA